MSNIHIFRNPLDSTDSLHFLHKGKLIDFLMKEFPKGFDGRAVYIVNGNKNTEIKTSMLAGKMHASCNACYDLEANKNSFDVISSRVYYLKELKSAPMDTYSTANFNLYHTGVACMI